VDNITQWTTEYARSSAIAERQRDALRRLIIAKSYKII